MTSTTLQLTDRQRERLSVEHVIWVTTVKPNRVPVPTPVWFSWSSGEFLIFSEPDTPKLTNIAAHPTVAINFNSTPEGGDVAVFTGEAIVDADGPSSAEWDDYVAKYRSPIAGLDMTPESFRSSYSVLIRVRPHRVRGW